RHKTLRRERGRGLIGEGYYNPLFKSNRSKKKRTVGARIVNGVSSFGHYVRSSFASSN
ncbi:hypothetical protein MKW98_020467, partial [Papaver atlanticum]